MIDKRIRLNNNLYITSLENWEGGVAEVLKIYAYLVVVLLVLALLSSIIVHAASFYYSYTRSIELYAPAVTGGSEEGVLSKIKLYIGYPGSGRVFFSAYPLTELDTQAAARVAALVASSLAGVNYYDYDYYVVMESESMVVGGPSASALMAVGFLALILNKTVYTNVSMTGMVNPDGTIGPVGGLKGKLEAVAKAGFKVFLIPIGERIVLVPNVTIKKYPWGVYKSVSYVKIDLVKYGEELGVKVVEVASIREAFEYFTGYKLEYRSAFNPRLPDKFIENLVAEAQNFISNASSYVEKTRGILDKVPSKYRNYIREVIDDIEVEIGRAREYLSEEKILLSVNTGFTAAYESQYIYWITLYTIDSLNIDNVVSTVNKTINIVYDKLAKTLNKYSKSIKLSDFEILVGAYTRFVEAGTMYSKALSYLEKGYYAEALQSLAYSYWRAYSVLSWMKMLEIVESPNISMEKIKNVIYTLYSIADSITSYAYTLAKDLGTSPNYLNRAFEYLNKAKEFIYEENYVGAVGETLYATLHATLSIHELFISNKTVIPSLIERIEVEAKYNLLQLSNNYSVAVLPIYYYLYAEELIEDNMFNEALLPLLLSILHSKKDILLLGGSSAPSETRSNENIVQPINTPTPSPTTPNTVGPATIQGFPSTGLRELLWFVVGLVLGSIIILIIWLYTLSRKSSIKQTSASGA